MKKYEELNCLDKGTVVYIDPRYDWTERRDGKKFFVACVSDESVLLADTKKQALAGNGYLYSISDVQ